MIARDLGTLDSEARERFVRRACAALVAVFSFLPIANLIGGDIRTASYATDALSWLVGGGLLVGVAAAVSAFADPWERAARWLGARWAMLASARGFAPSLGLGAFALFAVISHLVFDARPLLVDETTQARQAALFAAGRLSDSLSAAPEFFSHQQFIEDAHGRVVAQFPPGWSAVLALGRLLRLEWAMGPLFGAGAVLALRAFLRATGASAAFAGGAAALLAINPWFAFSSGTQMNHVPTACLLLVGFAFTARARTSTEHADRGFFFAGSAFGGAFLVRPLEAVLYAAVAVLWFASAEPRSRTTWRSVRILVGGCVMTGLWLLVWNWMMHGNPLALGYTVQWGPSHGLGFHAAPVGPAHTVLRGAALLNKYLLDLQAVAFESPLPGLLLPLLAIGLWRRRIPADAVLLVAAGALLLAYGAYWHVGDHLGPRFLIPLAPVLPIWMLRAPTAIAAAGSRLARATSTAVALSIAAGLLIAVPQRWRLHATSDATARLDVPALARQAGISGALVLVPVSWGSQVQPRVRGLGLSHPDSWWIFERVDLCRLDIAVGIAESRGLRGDAARRFLLPFTADSSRTVLDTTARGAIERRLPGGAYPPFCRAKQSLAERGNFFLGPLQVDGRDPNRYARDLHERNPRLLALHPDRAVYVLRRDPGQGARFHPLDRDSAATEWTAQQRAIDGAAARYVRPD